MPFLLLRKSGRVRRSRLIRRIRLNKFSSTKLDGSNKQLVVNTSENNEDNYEQDSRENSPDRANSQEYDLEDAESVSSANEKDVKTEKRDTKPKSEAHSEKEEESHHSDIKKVNDDSDSEDDEDSDIDPADGNNGELSEQEILDIAEQVFIKVSERMIEKNYTLRSLYSDAIQKVQINDEEHEILQPNDFIDAFKTLDFDSMREIEIECLLRVLLKPEIQDTILFGDLIMILDNFGFPEK